MVPVSAVLVLGGNADVTFWRHILQKNLLQGAIAYQQLDAFCLHSANCPAVRRAELPNTFAILTETVLFKIAFDGVS